MRKIALVKKQAARDMVYAAFA